MLLLTICKYFFYLSSNVNKLSSLNAKKASQLLPKKLKTTKIIQILLFVNLVPYVIHESTLVATNYGQNMQMLQLCSCNGIDKSFAQCRQAFGEPIMRKVANKCVQELATCAKLVAKQ